MKSHSSCCRSKRIVEDASLKEWHQTYHLYRVAVNCFIGAVESYKNERYEEALDLFIVTFHVNDKVLKEEINLSCCLLTSRSWLENEGPWEYLMKERPTLKSINLTHNHIEIHSKRQYSAHVVVS